MVAMTHKRDGRSARWESHRAARREELVKAAMYAVEKHGAAVGMDQIAAEAGTSKAVYYRHFDDKADLYGAVGQHMIGVLQTRVATKVTLATDTRAMIAAGIDAFLAVLEKTPEVYRFVVQNPVVAGPSGGPVADYLTIMAKLVDGLIRSSSTIDPSVDTRPWASMMVGFIKAGGDWWLANPDLMTRAELTESMTDLLWNGVQRFGNSAENGSPTA